MSRILGATTGRGDICTLNGSINASVLSIPISGTGQEALAIGYRDAWTQPYIVKIDNELILVNSSTTSTLTVAPISGSLPTGGRGYQGTTASSHTSGAKVQFSYIIDRSANSGNLAWMAAAETAVRASSGDSTWHYGAWRQYNPNGPGGIDNDWVTSRERGTTMALSWQPATGTYIGDANAINAAGTNSTKTAWTNLGDDWVEWQNTYGGLDDGIGATFMACLVHEANLDGNGTPAEWRAFYQAVFDLWISRGVQLWEGHNAPGTGGPVTTQEGMIIFTNMSGGSFNADWNNNPDLYTEWWPANWTWGNDNIQMAGIDFYNRGPAFRRFINAAGDSSQPGSAVDNGFYDWAKAKTAALLAGTGTTGGVSKTLIHGINEIETGEGRIAPATSGLSTGQYDSVHTSWTTAAAPTTSQSPSAGNWILDALASIKSFWPELYTLQWFDNAVNSITDWQSDTTQAKWDATVTFNTDPIWDLVATPPATSSAKTFVFG